MGLYQEIFKGLRSVVPGLPTHLTRETPPPASAQANLATVSASPDGPDTPDGLRAWFNKSPEPASYPSPVGITQAEAGKIVEEALKTIPPSPALSQASRHLELLLQQGRVFDLYELEADARVFIKYRQSPENVILSDQELALRAVIDVHSGNTEQPLLVEEVVFERAV